MSSGLYPLGRQAIGDGLIIWTSDDIRCYLLSPTYVYSDAHQFHSNLSGIIASMSTGMTGKTNTLGVFDANDVVFPTVTSGSTVTGLAVAKWTGTSSTSRLIGFYDHSTSGSALGYATNGLDITVRWPNGPTKMFKI